MSTTKTKKKKKKKNRLRVDRVLIVVVILGIILAITIYTIHSNNVSKIDIPSFESFQNIRATLQTEAVENVQTEDTTISLDYPTGTIDKLNPLDLSAQYVYIFDRTNNQILFDKNSTMKCYPASTTKILTSIIATEYIDLNTVFTVGTEISFAESDSSSANLIEGDQLSLKDLLYGLMLPSGNDAAYTIAVNVAKLVSGNAIMTDNEAVTYFVNLMNKKAQELGMYDSNFVVPDGYHDKNHYVTAQDMMKLLIYAKNLDILNEVTSTQSYTATGTLGQEYNWTNTNQLINENSSYYYEGVNGFKTGFHDDAGNCLIVTTNLNGREIYAIIMKSATDTDRYNDATRILDCIYNPDSVTEIDHSNDYTPPVEDTSNSEEDLNFTFASDYYNQYDEDYDY